MSLRIERLKELIREEAAQTITQDLSDPRLGFCTVTRVDLTNDLAYCTVYVSVFGARGVKSRSMHALKDARGLIQSRIAKRLKTRTTPVVSLELDESIEKSFEVLDRIKDARATDGTEPQADAPAESGAAGEVAGEASGEADEPKKRSGRTRKPGAADGESDE